MTTIIAESPGGSALFNECIPVNLLTPGRNQESISCPIDVNLRIGERRLDNNEREIRIEVSRPDDFEFLFGEGLTRQKYASLAEAWHLNVDFEDFPKRIIRLVRERDSASCPVQINCNLNSDQSTCILEIVRHIDVQTVKIAIELKKVRGEELMCHAMSNLRLLKAQVTKLSKEKNRLASEQERREAIELEYAEYKERMENELAECQRKFQEADTRAHNEAEKREEVENDLHLEREAKETAEQALDDLRHDVNHLEDKRDELEEDVSALLSEYAELEDKIESLNCRIEDAERGRDKAEHELSETRRRLSQTEQDLTKAKEVIRKYVQKDRSAPRPSDAPSIDEKKLSELQADIRERDDLVTRLSESQSAAKKRCEELHQENEMLRRSVEEYRAKEVERQKMVESYAVRHRSTVGLGTPPSGVNPVTCTAVTPHGTLMHPQLPYPTTNSGVIRGYGGGLSYTPVLGNSRFVNSHVVGTPMRNSPQNLPLRYQTPGLFVNENLSPGPLNPPTQPNKL